MVEVFSFWNNLHQGNAKQQIYSRRKLKVKNLKQTIKESLLSTVNDAEFVGLQGSYFVDPSKDFNLANLDNFYDILRDAAKFLNLDLKKMK